MTSTATTHHQRAARSATAATRLGNLPAEIIERVLSCGLSPLDLAAANAASRLFRGAPGGRSPVEHALRERACARGHDRALPTELPAGVRSWTEELFAREGVLARARAHASAVTAGYHFSAFLDADGGLHTCGEVEEEEVDEDGELMVEYRAHISIGHTDVPPVLVPMRVDSLSAVCVVAVAGGDHHLLALSDDGAVYGCGDNESGQLGLGDREERRSFVEVYPLARESAVAIAAGGYHSLALTAAGCAYSWGDNLGGQLGHGDKKERREPTRIEALDGVRVGGISTGDCHTLLLSAQGAVYSCGWGHRGRLGHGHDQDQHTPRRIEALAGVRAVHVSAGYTHSLVVDAAGGVHAFGDSAHTEAGHAASSRRFAPACIEALAGMCAVRACAGDRSSAVVCADGSVHTFGRNEYGQLGSGAPAGSQCPAHSRVLVQERITGCAFGGRHSLFVTAGGRVYSAGRVGAALGQGVSAADPEEQLPPGLRSGDGLPMLIDGLPRVLGRC